MRHATMPCWILLRPKPVSHPSTPRDVVRKFAGILKEYGVSAVAGDRYAGETFVQDFFEDGVSYRLPVLTKSQIYEAFEPRINAGEVEWKRRSEPSTKPNFPLTRHVSNWQSMDN
jgi:hypothetical protein